MAFTKHIHIYVGIQMIIDAQGRFIDDYLDDRAIKFSKKSFV